MGSDPVCTVGFAGLYFMYACVLVDTSYECVCVHGQAQCEEAVMGSREEGDLELCSGFSSYECGHLLTEEFWRLFINRANRSGW